MFEFIKRIFATGSAAPKPRPLRQFPPAGKLQMKELARRLGMSESELRSVDIAYQEFQIPKRSGGFRTIAAPVPALKAVQRTILHRLLNGLKAHPAATGFEPGHSIVTNALPHAGKEMVIKLDLVDFFPSITSVRIEEYFGGIGWDAECSSRLTELCTFQGALPQGAPTSPRLSNLANYRLDARIAALAIARGASYTRYADDITISVSVKRTDQVGRSNDLIHGIDEIVRDEGYALHKYRKLQIIRSHHRQTVTGLVVNAKPNLSRSTRRWLRAIVHHIKTDQPASITPEQLQGWRSLQAMIAAQTEK